MPNTLSYVSYRTSKLKLIQQLKPFSKREFARYINPIIAANRSISLSEAQQKKYLESDEVLELLNKIGEPVESFGKEVFFENTRIARFSLERKIPYLNSNEFRRKIIYIIMNHRGLPLHEAKYTKRLHTNEVIAFLKEIREPV